MCAVDRDRWTPPVTRAVASAADLSAMFGTRLWDQPAHATARAEVLAFITTDAPLALEIGFDHGDVLLANAAAFSDHRWLGCELRQHRADAARDEANRRALDNCLPLRADARAVLAALIPDARLARVDALFPTPALTGKHLLFTEAFVALLADKLAPGGVLTVATDVPAYAAHLRSLLARWRAVQAPPRAEARSRREYVCARDNLSVTWLSVTPPVVTLSA